MRLDQRTVAASIRREVRRWLDPLAVVPEAEADLVLAVNEAASNVVDHAYRSSAGPAVIELTPLDRTGNVVVGDG